MDEFIKLFNRIYDLSPIPLRLAYAFWIGLIATYYYAYIHDKYNVKPKPREFEEKNFSRAMPFLGIGNVLLYWWATSEKFWWAVDISIQRISTPIGFILMALGLWVVFLGRAAINGYWGPHLYVYKNPKDRKIIRHGIYKTIRHPIYSGQVYMAIGTLFLSNSFVFLPFAVLLLIINVVRTIREERYLSHLYSEDFKDYKKKTYYAIPSIL